MLVSEFSVWVTSAHDRYKRIKKLLESAKNDPPTEPYRSKYAAKDKINQLLTELDKKWASYGNIQVKLLYALFNFDIGVIAIETDEVAAGCDALSSSWEYIKDSADVPEGCHLALKVLNQLGIVWSERGESQKALEYLTKAEQTYNTYKSIRNDCPYDTDDMFVLRSTAEREWCTYEKTFTYTLYYMAQVYEILEENDRSANCCRETLKRQKLCGDYDVNDWALNCATLSQYYTKKENFINARHLLCCASEALSKKEQELDKNVSEEENDLRNEFRQTKAAVSCLWIKYCISMIGFSSGIDLIQKEILQQLLPDIFKLSHDKDILDLEEDIPVKVKTYEEAKKVFLIAVDHVREAKSYYTLNTHANNYVQIVQDHSNLYKNLARFENDSSRCCKMFKRRIDLLEEVLKKLNPQYYLAVCRQLQYELGEIYFEMVDLKCKIAKSSTKNITNHAINKINSLILQCITHFNGFIKSFQDKEEKDPSIYSDDYVRSALMAYLYTGRLHSKLIERDSNRKLHNLAKSEECYKYIIDYINRNPDHMDHMEAEYPIVQDILELMPDRIAQVKASNPMMLISDSWNI